MNLLAETTWTRVVELLFGIGASSAGEGRESKLEWTSLFPTWLTITLLVGAAVYVIVIYSHERTTRGALWRYGLAAIRVVLIGMVVFMLYHLVIRPYRTDLPDLVVVLDDSASMGHVDTYDDSSLAAAMNARLKSARFGEATRANLAKTLLLESDGDLIEQLNRRYNVKYFLASTLLRPLAGAGEGGENDLPNELREFPADRSESKLG